MSESELVAKEDEVKRRTVCEEDSELRLIDGRGHEVSEVSGHVVGPNSDRDGGSDRRSDRGPKEEGSDGESNVLMRNASLTGDLVSHRGESGSDTLERRAASRTMSGVKIDHRLEPREVEKKTYSEDLGDNESSSVSYTTLVDHETVSDHLDDDSDDLEGIKTKSEHRDGAQRALLYEKKLTCMSLYLCVYRMMRPAMTPKRLE